MHKARSHASSCTVTPILEPIDAIFLSILVEQEKEIIDDNKKIMEVATLSAKNTEIGELIAKVMEKVGKEGVVTVEDSNTIGNSFEIVEGLRFDKGYISAYMITDSEKMEAVMEEPYILVTDKKISSINELLPVLEKIIKTGKKELVIIAEDIEGDALATLVVNKLRGTFSVLAVKAPGYGDRRKEMLQDIAVVTGADFVSEEVGKKLENIELDSLGQAHRVVSDKENTTIVGGKGLKEEIEKRIHQIKIQMQKTESSFDKEKLQERLGKLAGGVAVIKVGAPIESAQKELKQRVDDAVAATKAAMEEGIVPGGGIALFNIRIKTTELKRGGVEEGLAGEEIINKSLTAPLEAIISNSGLSPEKVIRNLENQKISSRNISERTWRWIGFDATRNEITNLKEVGIIDPLKVVKTAFINAVSVASNYLTIGAAMTEIPEKKPPMPPMPGGMDY